MLVKSLTEYIRSHFSENGLCRIERQARKCCFGVSAKVVQKNEHDYPEKSSASFF